MAEAGELDGLPDLSDDGAVAPSWPLSIAMAAVILGAVVVGMLVLFDGGPPVSADGRGARASSASPLDTAPTTEPPTTTAPTTEPPTTTAPTTEPPPPTEPPPTEPPTTAPTTATPSLRDGFTATFPSPPRVGSVVVPTATGTATRSEYDVDGPDGSLISITAIATDLAGATPVTHLAAVAAQIGRDLGVRPTLGDPSTVGGAPAQPLRARTADGQVRAVVVYGAGRLYTVSMFTPGTGPTVAADAAFDDLVASFRLS